MPPKAILPQPLTRALYFFCIVGEALFPLFMQNGFWFFERLSQVAVTKYHINTYIKNNYYYECIEDKTCRTAY